MVEPSPLSRSMPDIGPPSDEARRSLALHTLADLRVQLVDAHEQLSVAIAELVALGDLPDSR